MHPSPETLETLRILLERGADPNAPGSNPLMIVCQVIKNAMAGSNRPLVSHAVEFLALLINLGANPFRSCPPVFKLNAFQFMLSLDVPSYVVQTCLDKLQDGEFVETVETTAAAVDTTTERSVNES